MIEQRERAIGSILGLAIGDALGAPFEFQRRERIPSPLPAFELTWLGYPPGTWTDDTALARNLWLSLIEHGGRFDASDVRARHVAWLEARPPDVGNQTALALLEPGPEPARKVFERRGPEVSAGNGSVMYCAPLGVVRANEPDRLFDEAPALSRITHWDERCQTACLAVTLAVASLVTGSAPDGAVIGAVEAVADRDGAEELEYLVDEAGVGRQIDGPGQGYCLFTAGIALQVVGHGLGFEQGLRHVVSVGGDTDTNAAVAGALLGAAHGVDAIPAAWLDKLDEAAELRGEAERLAKLATGA